jgi:RHS repeat-associated protein
MTLERLAAALCLLLSVQAQGAVSDAVPGQAVPYPSLARMASSRPATAAGQSATQLPDGRWLLLGGRDREHGALADARVFDPKSGLQMPLAHGLLSPRSGHTATLLPDGTVLVLGGADANGNVLDTAEQFSPLTGRFSALGRLGLLARVHHSATILADGRLLIAGGVDGRGLPVFDAELYNTTTRYAEHFDAKLEWARLAHLAALLPSSKVLLWGGMDAQQQVLTNGELFDPLTSGFEVASADQADLLAAPLFGTAPPEVVNTVPVADAVDVSIDQRLIVRFSKRMAPNSLNDRSVTLLGPHGAVSVNVVALEEGSLLFVTPQQQLLPASRYTLFIKGATDVDGRALAFTALGWTTVGLGAKANGTTVVTGTGIVAAAPATSVDSPSPALSTTATAPGTPAAVGKPAAPGTTSGSDPNGKQEEWYPGEGNFNGNWRARRPASALQTLPSLQAPPGVTALSGQVLTLQGAALANVNLKIGGQSAQTDETGRFLLQNVAPGTQVLAIDGNAVKQRGGNYGFYLAQVKIEDKKTNVLGYTIWLSRLDPAGKALVPSPTVKETVLTTPRIPGLELHLPPGTVIRDIAGNIVTELNMTAIPTDRPPFPIPAVGVPVYFTIQPGGAVIENINGSKLQGARLIYPNFSGAAPGTRIAFWNYDPREKGWYIYGRGTVTKDGKQIVPDPGVAIYEFSGAMVSQPDNAPPDGPPCDPCHAGDPVDVYTGLFLHENLDLAVKDIIPLEVRRSYRQRDSLSRAFGIGANLSYDIFIIGDTFPYTYMDLILPDGGRIHFPRSSPGTDYGDAVYTHQATGSKYDGATIRHDVSCFWLLKLKTGEQICFPESFGVSNPRGAAATGMTDRFGNILQLERDTQGNLVRATSPNGRSLQFFYDTNNRIIQAVDNIGRQAAYEYDSVGHMVKATLADGSFEAYTYDGSGNMMTVQDARGNVMVTNVYDENNRVRKQTYADGQTSLFSYSLDTNGRATQVDVTNERGVITRYVFDSTGSPTSITRARGLPEQQTLTFERDANGLLLSRTDALGRRTSYAYDSNGNLISKTLLAGTAEAVTETMTYTGDYNYLASATDALGHQSLFSYDSSGNLTQATDGNGNVTKFVFNNAGLLTQVTDALGKVYTRNYDGGDVTDIVDPLNRAMHLDSDSVGRGISITNAIGNQTLVSYDQLDRVTQVTDPLGNSTSTRFDANGNPIEVRDAKGNVHRYGYDPRDRLTTYTDPLQQTERYDYDAAGNLVNITDRKGQVTKFAYDNLDRLRQITYADGSTIGYSYDQGNRVTQIVDSVNGSYSYAYDSFDRIASETTPKATISYSYYANGLRKTMTVSGQPTLRYSYDSGGRLRRIDQDAGATNNNTVQSIAFSYDVLNRRTQTQLPNGMTQNYSYDDAGQLTGIVYRGADGSVIGDLSYTYDATGKRIKIGGSLARTSLPDDAGNATVDAANRLTSWKGVAFTYDANGNLIADGTSTYVWNTRDQLAQIKDGNGSPVAAFAYDALGRRLSKTVNGKALGYVYDGMNVVQTLDGASVNNSDFSNVLTNYLSGLGLDEVYAASGVVAGTLRSTNYLSNALGSTISLFDQTGAKLVDYTYDPYGNTSSDGLDGNLFQYTGRESDETGLYYYRARYYSPKLGRFISSDPIGLKGGINTYAYVNGNPLGRVDPLGLWATSAHNYFIDKAFSDLDPAIRDIIKDGSAYADSMKFQDDAHSYMHAMSSDSLNPAAAKSAMCKYIKDYMDKAEDAKNNNDAHYWFYLGMALHPVMDSTSPAHAGFQKWHGAMHDGSKHGPWPSSLENLSVASRPEHTTQTVDAMNRAMAGDLGVCGCQ